MSELTIVSEASDLSDYNKEGVIKLGKMVCEKVLNSPRKHQKYAKGLEALGITKEAMTVGQTDLFTTAISGFIEKKLRSKLVAAELIKVIDNFDTRGQNALKIPIRAALITANDLPDSGLLTHASGSYTSGTITLTYKYASNQLTHELLKFANVDLIAEELGEIGSALSRKMDSDIISAFQTATTSGNGNLTQLGSGTYASYTALVNGLNSAKQNYAEPDVILMNPSTTAYLMINETKLIGGSQLVGSLAFKGDKGEHFPAIQAILGMRLVESVQCDADDIYLVDTVRTGYLVKAGSVETFDGRVSGYLAYEVIGALNYGVTIVQPKSIYRVEENA